MSTVAQEKQICVPEKAQISNNKVLKNNPVYFSNDELVAVHKAYEVFTALLEEYKKNKVGELSNEDIDIILQVQREIYNTYCERTARIYVESKFKNIAVRLLSTVASLTKKSNEEENDSVTDLWYYNNKHHIINHDPA
jgi:hypothetical protein